MCAIIDANAVHEVFGDENHEAGLQFRRWIYSGRGRLVVGGRLTAELSRASVKFRHWVTTVQSQGKILRKPDDTVNQREMELTDEGCCQSDDPHIIALAQVSGARLLYSNDKSLQQDFKNKDLINNPRGKVYTTNESRGNFSSGHKKLLARRDLCQSISD
ncbi:MAG: hypothetical protein OXF84_11845 [Bacteroidetes bacterium]|nr:hypothetical protein [Bacteroidota bacterium]